MRSLRTTYSIVARQNDPYEEAYRILTACLGDPGNDFLLLWSRKYNPDRTEEETKRRKQEDDRFEAAELAHAKREQAKRKEEQLAIKWRNENRQKAKESEEDIEEFWETLDANRESSSESEEIVPVIHYEDDGTGCENAEDVDYGWD